MSTEKSENSFGPRGRWFSSSRGFAFALILAVCFAAVLFLGSRVADRMAALRAAPQDNVQWSLAQLDVELLALQVAVQAASLPDRSLDLASLQEVRRRFDVFYSRVGTIEALPIFGTNVQATQSNLDSIRQSIKTMSKAVDGPDDQLRAQLPGLISEIEKMRPETRKITLEGVKRYASEADQARGDFASLLRQTAIVNTFLILALGAALVFLFRQIRISRGRAAEIEASSARNASTVRASLDAIIVTDLEGKVVEFNPAAVQTFGYSRNAAIGSYLDELIIPERFRDAHRKGMDRMRRTGVAKVVGAGRVEMFALKSDGSEFPVEMSLALNDSPQGRVVTGFLRDISERVKKDAELRRARDEALQAANAKSQFLAVMSHEMRTPLNGVMALLDLLAGTKLTPKQQAYVATATTSAEILKQHVDDVLDLTRIQAGKMELFPRVFNLVELLEEVQSLNLATASKRGNRIKLSFAMPEPYFVADRKRLHQILTNLMGNAIKFTENGRIDLGASFVSVQADVVEVLFEVTDNGIGIAAEHQKVIFDEFVTLDNSLQRNASGAGLGLPICKQIVESMGGTIGVDSTLGQGTRFWFKLPLKAAFGEGSETTSRRLETKSRPVRLKLNVLVVEDNETNRFVANELLNSLGCDVTMCDDGAQGVRAARRERFDLVLMDISMPVMNGWDAARAIRVGHGKSSRSKIIALTAHALPEVQNLLDDSGMDGILIKPLRRDDLVKLIQSTAKNATQVPRAFAQGRGSIDLQVANEMRELLGPESYAVRIGKFKQEMREGLVELAKLSKSNDVKPFGELAHRLKGTASVFGAVVLGDILQKLQDASGTKSKRQSYLAEADREFRNTTAALDRSFQA